MLQMRSVDTVLTNASVESVQQGYDDGLIPIDKGNEVLMIENFRNEGVWKEFMKNPYVKKGMDKVGFRNL